ncbi:alpha/beta fold hydrolase [Arthrobacter sp. zg-Y820]|uniref:alpha/beta fold hydrolase n=1 Tax=unclassified Arthrobacter TaxID=235627 RepID=UPI001E492A9C|nr:MULTISPECIES: alpha/beta fold hydrolase [unclassified Arthrobacter]MCC9198370.1 alpha/beta fold hydrolase [Arthrobacter sp. zg-Y820]MDK1281240.1 alpha/beta fold hydrolase [Arthrobacter sp. zg.Y820]WIB09827.1 alpha/beta fold hydrolase [Arthrobacter sp. zg-Y820]
MKANRQRTVETDGARLAVFEYGQPAAPATPTVLLVHGYPDDHTVFAGVIEDLAADHRVIAYDTRNAGASRLTKEFRGGTGTGPEEIAAGSPLAPYRLPVLVADLCAVLADAGGPVHLVGHDWGSIQCWAAVRDARAAGRVLSFTSISGPDLGHLRRWFRQCLRSPRRWLLAVGQALRSSYVAFFQLPVLPELLCRRLGPQYARRAGTSAEAATGNAVRGLQLYRANLLGSGVSAREPLPPVEVPVHVLVPLHDPFLSPRLTDGLAAEVPDLRISAVDGGHWWPAENSAAFCRMLRQLTGS